MMISPSNSAFNMALPNVSPSNSLDANYAVPPAAGYSYTNIFSVSKVSIHKIHIMLIKLNYFYLKLISKINRK